MNLNEFETGIKVDLSYIPCKLKAQWFREVETYYTNKCSNKEEAYSRFRKEIRERVKDLKAWKFSTNLELQACLSLALQRLDKQFGAHGARDRHDWNNELCEIVGSSTKPQMYGETNNLIQWIRKTLKNEEQYSDEVVKRTIMEGYAPRLVNTVQRESKFSGFESDYSHERQQREVALAIVLYLMSETFRNIYEEQQFSVEAYGKFSPTLSIFF